MTPIQTPGLDKKGGVLIEIGKGDEKYTLGLFHLKNISVINGEQIRCGQYIGVMADVGSQGKYHLHVQLKDSTGQTINFMTEKWMRILNGIAQQQSCYCWPKRDTSWYLG